MYFVFVKESSVSLDKYSWQFAHKAPSLYNLRHYFLFCNSFLPVDSILNCSVFSRQFSVDLDDNCNSICDCDINYFAPICSTNNVTYFSPCYAGCPKEHTVGETKVNSIRINSWYRRTDFVLLVPRYLRSVLVLDNMRALRTSLMMPLILCVQLRVKKCCRLLGFLLELSCLLF